MEQSVIRVSSFTHTVASATPPTTFLDSASLHPGYNSKAHTRAPNFRKRDKELKGREARKIKFLRPLSFDFAQDGELVEPCSLRLRHPTWDGYSRPTICDLCALCD
jgi:hypothetical protein